ncbi:GNAT family N-acetyltransferase [Salinimicrobium terrae]|uniref:GNAT family N-acetyltransferase n=1 Tax=Salinimicrobium terrae TaxID=470866 RepID=UPI0003FA78C1|nr:GNAT family N-acetyltransferase [Salinimicrobium terrae]
MIRKAELKDLASIKSLTEACAVKMQEKGIFQWNEHYPSMEKLQQDINKQELFLLEEREQLLGIIVLTPQMDEEYIPIDWLTESGNNLYVHRLATEPSTWGSGNGQRLMDFAEDYAREQNYDSLRLDTFSQNKRNQQFYARRDYQRLGNVYFPKQSRHPFYCYELVLE